MFELPQVAAPVGPAATILQEHVERVVLLIIASSVEFVSREVLKAEETGYVVDCAVRYRQGLREHRSLL